MLLNFLLTKREDFVTDVKGRGMAAVSMRLWISVYFMKETDEQMKLQQWTVGGANFSLVRGLPEKIP